MALTAPSSTLTGQTIAASYDQVLFLDAAAGVTEATLQIVSGTTGKTALSISDEHVLVKGVDTNNAAGFEVQQTDGTSILKVAAGTPSVLVSGSGVKLYFSDAGGEYLSGDGTDLTITSGNDIVLAVGSGGSAYCAGAGGTSNTVFGLDAGDQLASGDNYNVFIGHSVATANMTNAASNTGVGYLALTALTEGDNNTAVGRSALAANTTGHENEAFGAYALAANEDGVNNVAMGTSALAANTDGSSNTAIGRASMETSTSPEQNVAIGHSALAALATGAGNVAIGYQAMDAVNDDESSNIAIGSSAMGAADQGSHASARVYANIAIGENALTGGDFGSSDLQLQGNIAIGYGALDATSSSAQTGTIAIGHNAGTAINHADAAGAVLIGHSAGAALTSGQANVIIGLEAGDAITTGDYNTLIGHASGTTIDDSLRNTGVGYYTLLAYNGSNSEGDNTALGYGAGTWASTGQQNTFVGSQAGQGITGTRLTGNGNTTVGYQAGLLLQGAGAGNTCLGVRAGDVLTTGDDNILIGRDVAMSGATVDSEIVIGVGATGGGTNTATIGNASMTDVYMAEDGGATVHCGAINIESINNQLQIKSSAADGGAAALEFVADAGGDNNDFVQIFVANSGVMQFNDKSTGSYVTNMSITAATGTVDVVGELTAGTKTFKIDHPVDPDNKILYHMAVESPRVDLIYRGMAKLVNGKATVDLNKDSGIGMMDGTFEALTQNAVVVSLQNQDSFDNVKPGSISGSLFEITCNNPACSDEVAWVVMAERADRFIKTLSKTDAQGRLIPEEDKELPDLSLLEDKEEDTDNIEDDGQERFIPVDMEGKKGYRIYSKAYGDMPTRKVTKKYREKQ